MSTSPGASLVEPGALGQTGRARCTWNRARLTGLDRVASLPDTKHGPRDIVLVIGSLHELAIAGLRRFGAPIESGSTLAAALTQHGSESLDELRGSSNRFIPGGRTMSDNRQNGCGDPAVKSENGCAYYLFYLQYTAFSGFR